MMVSDGGIRRFPVPGLGDTISSGRPSPTQPGRGKGTGPSRNGNDFAAVLGQERARARDINFSAHAKQRLQDRSIELGPEELGKLARAVDKAADKGCRASLLLYKDMAFVAGVDNRTIITALDGQSMKEHVFTNIDSAVVVE